MAAVAAGVRERPQRAVFAPDQQNAPRAVGFGPLVTRLGQLLAARHAHPAAAEEVPLLPLEHRGVHVRRARQHQALPEGPERILQPRPVDRSQVPPVIHILTDHTVKTKPPA